MFRCNPYTQRMYCALLTLCNHISSTSADILDSSLTYDTNHRGFVIARQDLPQKSEIHNVQQLLSGEFFPFNSCVSSNACVNSFLAAESSR